MRVTRSVAEPPRGDLSWDERWLGPDEGLVLCWENGRRARADGAPESIRAGRGELPVLVWKGGVSRDVKVNKTGTLQYLATWQGLRGDHLDIDTECETALVCTATGQRVVYSRRGGSEEAQAKRGPDATGDSDSAL